MRHSVKVTSRHANETGHATGARTWGARSPATCPETQPSITTEFNIFYSGFKTRLAVSTLGCWDAKHFSTHELYMWRQFEDGRTMLSGLLCWPCIIEAAYEDISVHKSPLISSDAARYASEYCVQEHRVDDVLAQHVR